MVNTFDEEIDDLMLQGYKKNWKQVIDLWSDYVTRDSPCIEVIFPTLRFPYCTALQFIVLILEWRIKHLVYHLEKLACILYPQTL
jgi:hypothetical protein